MNSFIRNSILLVVSFLLFACSGQQPPTVPFADLVADPGRYDGLEVCTEGVYLQGFEASSLGAATYEQDGFLYLAEPVIWLEGAALELQGACTEFREYAFCPATACGLFETGDGFGHLGGYAHQMTAPD